MLHLVPAVFRRSGSAPDDANRLIEGCALKVERIAAIFIGFKPGPSLLIRLEKVVLRMCCPQILLIPIFL